MLQNNFIKDPWLSDILGIETLRLKIDESFVKELISNQEARAALRKRQQERVFMYAKVPTTHLSCAQLLEDHDFHLIDTNVILEKQILSEKSKKKKPMYEILKGGKWEIRFAEPRDEAGTVILAKHCFFFSRFHLDPCIPDETADTIKAQWAGNYFRGKRGDLMIVALKDGVVSGFLQLLRQGSTLVIDLIGVHKEHCRLGIGGMLIEYAEVQCKDFKMLQVGTQIANAPSLRFYEKYGFLMVGSSYVFHFHGRDSIERTS